MQKFFLLKFPPTCRPICAEASFSVVVYHVGLNGSVPDCCPAVPGSNLASP
jgi:hypothetical protein